MKVKQFDIRGSKIFNEHHTVKYPNKARKWYYFTVVRPSGLPIKISSDCPEKLQTVQDGIEAYLDKEGRMRERRRMEEDRIYRETYY